MEIFVEFIKNALISGERLSIMDITYYSVESELRQFGAGRSFIFTKTG